MIWIKFMKPQVSILTFFSSQTLIYYVPASHTNHEKAYLENNAF